MLKLFDKIKNPNFDYIATQYSVDNSFYDLVLLGVVKALEYECDPTVVLGKKFFNKMSLLHLKRYKKQLRRQMKQDKSRCLKIEQLSEQQEPDKKEIVAVLEPTTSLPSVLSPLQLQQLAKDLLPLLIQHQEQFMSKEQDSS
ncbi:MAG: hypothetical protein LBU60_06175 [Clostridiales bacterium]|nr:hypothetical protein [Clostridiales bacterium]